MRNFVQAGRVVTATAPATVSSGDLVVVGSLFGVAATDAASGDDVEIETEGVFDIPKVVADVIAAGNLLYWDAAASKVTKTAGTGSKPLVGVALAAAGNGTTTARVKLLTTGQTGPA